MRELSLFSGAGGGLLGTKLLGWNHVGYVEYNEYCQKVIAQRIKDGYLDNAPIFGDIRAFISEGYADSYQGMVDVVTGGFPCQPFSVAGKRAAADDPRNMWPQTIEVVRRVKPAFCYFENVPGLLSASMDDESTGLVQYYFGEILRDLAESGYAVRWRCLSAAETGAPHKRDRLWIMAYSKSERYRERRKERDIYKTDGRQNRELRSKFSGSGQQPKNTPKEINDSNTEHDGQLTAEIARSIRKGNDDSEKRSKPTSEFKGLGGSYTNSESKPNEFKYDKAVGVLANASKPGLQGREETRNPEGSRKERDKQPAGCGQSYQSSYWCVEPDVGRVVNGVAHRVDRLKALGNGQVPAVVRAAWRLLNEKN